MRWKKKIAWSCFSSCAGAESRGGEKGRKNDVQSPAHIPSTGSPDHYVPLLTKATFLSRGRRTLAVDLPTDELAAIGVSGSHLQVTCLRRVDGRPALCHSSRSATCAAPGFVVAALELFSKDYGREHPCCLSNASYNITEIASCVLWSMVRDPLVAASPTGEHALLLPDASQSLTHVDVVGLLAYLANDRTFREDVYDKAVRFALRGQYCELTYRLRGGRGGVAAGGRPGDVAHSRCRVPEHLGVPQLGSVQISTVRLDKGDGRGAAPGLLIVLRERAAKNDGDGGQRLGGAGATAAVVGSAQTRRSSMSMIAPGFDPSAAAPPPPPPPLPPRLVRSLTTFSAAERSLSSTLPPSGAASSKLQWKMERLSSSPSSSPSGGAATTAGGGGYENAAGLNPTLIPIPNDRELCSLAVDALGGSMFVFECRNSDVDDYEDGGGGGDGAGRSGRPSVSGASAATNDTSNRGQGPSSRYQLQPHKLLYLNSRARNYLGCGEAISAVELPAMPLLGLIFGHDPDSLEAMLKAAAASEEGISAVLSVPSRINAAALSSAAAAAAAAIHPYGAGQRGASWVAARHRGRQSLPGRSPPDAPALRHHNQNPNRHLQYQHHHHQPDPSCTSSTPSHPQRQPPTPLPQRSNVSSTLTGTLNAELLTMDSLSEIQTVGYGDARWLPIPNTEDTVTSGGGGGGAAAAAAAVAPMFCTDGRPTPVAPPLRQRSSGSASWVRMLTRAIRGGAGGGGGADPLVSQDGYMDWAPSLLAAPGASPVPPTEMGEHLTPLPPRLLLAAPPLAPGPSAALRRGRSEDRINMQLRHLRQPSGCTSPSPLSKVSDRAADVDNGVTVRYGPNGGGGGGGAGSGGVIQAKPSGGDGGAAAAAAEPSNLTIVEVQRLCSWRNDGTCDGAAAAAGVRQVRAHCLARAASGSQPSPLGPSPGHRHVPTLRSYNRHMPPRRVSSMVVLAATRTTCARMNAEAAEGASLPTAEVVVAAAAGSGAAVHSFDGVNGAAGRARSFDIALMAPAPSATKRDAVTTEDAPPSIVATGYSRDGLAPAAAESLAYGAGPPAPVGDVTAGRTASACAAEGSTDPGSDRRPPCRTPSASGLTTSPPDGAGQLSMPYPKSRPLPTALSKVSPSLFGPPAPPPSLQQPTGHPSPPQSSLTRPRRLTTECDPNRTDLGRRARDGADGGTSYPVVSDCDDDAGCDDGGSEVGEPEDGGGTSGGGARAAAATTATTGGVANGGGGVGSNTTAATTAATTATAVATATGIPSVSAAASSRGGAVTHGSLGIDSETRLASTAAGSVTAAATAAGASVQSLSDRDERARAIGPTAVSAAVSLLRLPDLTARPAGAAASALAITAAAAALRPRSAGQSPHVRSIRRQGSTLRHRVRSLLDQVDPVSYGSGGGAAAAAAATVVGYDTARAISSTGGYPGRHRVQRAMSAWYGECTAHSAASSSGVPISEFGRSPSGPATRGSAVTARSSSRASPMLLLSTLQEGIQTTWLSAESRNDGDVDGPAGDNDGRDSVGGGGNGIATEEVATSAAGEIRVLPIMTVPLTTAAVATGAAAGAGPEIGPLGVSGPPLGVAAASGPSPPPGGRKRRVLRFLGQLLLRSGPGSDPRAIEREPQEAKSQGQQAQGSSLQLIMSYGSAPAGSRGGQRGREGQVRSTTAPLQDPGTADTEEVPRSPRAEFGDETAEAGDSGVGIGGDCRTGIKASLVARSPSQIATPSLHSTAHAFSQSSAGVGSGVAGAAPPVAAKRRWVARWRTSSIGIGGASGGFLDSVPSTASSAVHNTMSNCGVDIGANVGATGGGGGEGLGLSFTRHPRRGGGEGNAVRAGIHVGASMTSGDVVMDTRTSGTTMMRNFFRISSAAPIGLETDVLSSSLMLSIDHIPGGRGGGADGTSASAVGTGLTTSCTTRSALQASSHDFPVELEAVAATAGRGYNATGNRTTGTHGLDSISSTLLRFARRALQSGRRKGTAAAAADGAATTAAADEAANDAVAAEGLRNPAAAAAADWIPETMAGSLTFGMAPPDRYMAAGKRCGEPGEVPGIQTPTHGSGDRPVAAIATDTAAPERRLSNSLPSVLLPPPPSPLPELHLSTESLSPESLCTQGQGTTAAPPVVRKLGVRAVLDTALRGAAVRETASNATQVRAVVADTAAAAAARQLGASTGESNGAGMRPTGQSPAMESVAAAEDIGDGRFGAHRRLAYPIHEANTAAAYVAPSLPPPPASMVSELQSLHGDDRNMSLLSSAVAAAAAVDLYGPRRLPSEGITGSKAGRLLTSYLASAGSPPGPSGAVSPAASPSSVPPAPEPAAAAPAAVENWTSPPGDAPAQRYGVAGLAAASGLEWAMPSRRAPELASLAGFLPSRATNVGSGAAGVQRSRQRRASCCSDEMAAEVAAMAHCRITAWRRRDPGSKRTLLVLYMHDVTKAIQTRERTVKLLLQEHRVLEALFPRHVLTFLALNPAALGVQDQDESCGATHGRRSVARSSPFTALVAAAAGAVAEGEAAPAATSSESPAGRQRLESPASLCPSPSPPASQAHMHTVRRMLAAQQLASARVSQLATQHQMVTILIADCVGFTTMCRQIEARRVMQFLNELYSRCDALLDIYKVAKLETIGDAYVVAGGLVRYDADGYRSVLPEGEQDPLHAVRVVEFARAMLRTTRDLTLPHSGEPVRLRLGVHSGPVMSGVVGTKQPRFTVFGETVEVAKRVEQSGTPGRIHVSATTRGLLAAAQPCNTPPPGSPATSSLQRNRTGSGGGGSAAAGGAYRWEPTGGMASVRCSGGGHHAQHHQPHPHPQQQQHLRSLALPSVESALGPSGPAVAAAEARPTATAAAAAAAAPLGYLLVEDPLQSAEALQRVSDVYL